MGEAEQLPLVRAEDPRLGLDLGLELGTAAQQGGRASPQLQRRLHRVGETPHPKGPSGVKAGWRMARRRRRMVGRARL